MTTPPPYNPSFPGSTASLFFGQVPIGTIITWAGTIYSATSPPQSPLTSPPAFDPQAYGWLICDGRSLTIADYFSLYCVLGNLYGATDTTFTLPNFTGYFLRAVDTGNVIDKDQRTAATNGTNTGPGSTQESAIETHTHQYVEVQSPPAVPASPAGPDAFGLTTSAQTSPPTMTNSNNTHVSANETRPVNIAVYYLIKAW